MKIPVFYEKDKHVVILFNGLKYLFISRNNLDDLIEKIISYNTGKKLSFLALYNDVNSKDLVEISRVVNHLNDGGDVNFSHLERVLKKEEIN